MTSAASLATTATADPTLEGAVDTKLEQSQPKTEILPKLRKDFGFVPVPRHLQYDPTKPFHFGLLLNVAFGFASTFSKYLPPPSLAVEYKHYLL